MDGNKEVNQEEYCKDKDGIQGPIENIEEEEKNSVNDNVVPNNIQEDSSSSYCEDKDVLQEQLENIEEEEENTVNDTVVPMNFQQDSNSSIVNDKDKSAAPLISIPGFDRITTDSFSVFGKKVWILVLLFCSCVCCYQIVSCIEEYFYGDPAIKVYFRSGGSGRLPAAIICPADLTADNAMTDSLLKEYEKRYNVSRKDIYFSDLLRLPNVTMDTLWDLYNFSPKHLYPIYKCSASGPPDACVILDDIKVEPVRTSSGTCVVVKCVAPLKSYGPSSYVRIPFPISPPNWLSVHWYFRVIYQSIEVNPVFNQIQDGVAAMSFVSVKVAMNFKMIINLDLPYKPCKDSAEVETCIEDCIKNILYSTLSCRLPYMNKSLEDCDSAEKFNKSFSLARKVMMKRSFCIEKCPRKCEELIYVPIPDFAPKTSNSSYLELFVWEPSHQAIEEYHWYTFSSLFSDVGGSLGTFLGFCFLNIIEIFESITYQIKMVLKKRKNRVGNSYLSQMLSVGTLERSTQVSQQPIGTLQKAFTAFRVQNIRGLSRSLGTTNIDVFSISITGLDRLFNKSIAMSFKVFWLLTLVTASTVCLLQVNSTVTEFLQGLPDVMVTYERNNSIKFPSFTFCPIYPFLYAESIHYFKEKYVWDLNLTDIVDAENISLAQVIDLPDVDVQMLWNATKPKKFPTAHFKYTKILGMYTYDNYSDLTQSYVETLHGTCLTVSAPEMIEFEGMASNLIILFDNDYPTKTTELYTVQVHEDEDDYSLIDPTPKVAAPDIPFMLTLELVKIERLDHPQRPCASKVEVVECRRQCFYKMLLDESVNCSLPFLKKFPKPLCSTSAEFNHTMVTSEVVFSKFFSGNYCTCPQPFKEYIISANFGFFPAEFKFLPLGGFLCFIPSNLFTLVKDYYKMNINGVFANVCGSLGLFLGICLPSFLELFEYLIFIYKISSTKAEVQEL